MRYSHYPLLLITLLPVTLLAHPGASTTIEYFSHQIEHRPDQQALYIQRGIAYSADGQYDLALSDFNRAESLGDPVLVSFDLGVLYYRQGHLETSLNYFNSYLQRFPNHGRGLEYRARVLRDRGDFEGSVADFRRVFELEKQPNPGHYISVANMLSADGAAGIEEALTVLDEGNRKLGITPQLQYRAIDLEKARNRPDLAIKRMGELQDVLGDSPDWKVGLAELYLDAQQSSRAEALLDEAESQLASLRRTPARLTLQERISRLRVRLSS